MPRRSTSGATRRRDRWRSPSAMPRATTSYAACDRAGDVAASGLQASGIAAGRPGRAAGRAIRRPPSRCWSGSPGPGRSRCRSGRASPRAELAAAARGDATGAARPRRGARRRRRRAGRPRARSGRPRRPCAPASSGAASSVDPADARRRRPDLGHHRPPAGGASCRTRRSPRAPRPGRRRCRRPRAGCCAWASRTWPGSGVAWRALGAGVPLHVAPALRRATSVLAILRGPDAPEPRARSCRSSSRACSARRRPTRRAATGPARRPPRRSRRSRPTSSGARRRRLAGRADLRADRGRLRA